MTMLSASLAVRAGRTLPAGRRDTVALVARPAGVVHLAVAPLTPSGRWVARAGRTVCHARTRRLTVIGRRGGLPDITGRRLCGRCLRTLSSRTAVPGLNGRPMTRDEETEAFDLLTVEQLTVIATTCTTVDETHQVGRLASVLFGPATAKPRARRTPAEQARVTLDDTVHAARRRLTVAALSDEQREANVRARELETAERTRMQTARRRSDSRDRVAARQRAGSYLTTHERSLLNSA